MAVATTNLYPPVLDTYMPAFVINGNNTSCKIYFSLSEYNNISEIANAQVTISNQYNNLSVLDSTLYPCEIAIKTIYEDSNGYYITIANSDIQDGFINDTNYKVQIRFTSTDASALPTFVEGKQAIATWLTENLDYFSEWSRACLIYGISQPTIMAYYNENVSGSWVKTQWEPETEITWSQSAVVTFIGNIQYAESDETEYIKSYHIDLYDENDNCIESSGDIYPNNNTIEYTFKSRLAQGDDYYFIVNYTTISQYNEDVEFDFVIAEVTPSELTGTFAATADDENGCINIVYTPSSSSGTLINLLIKRSSSKDDFAFEYDIYKITGYKTSDGAISYSDKTIENGIFYKYSIQIIDSQGFLGTGLSTSKTLVSSQYAYINSKNKQLTLKFDSTVSSLKKVLTESVTNTLGSQFPFVRRNGDVNYYQFPITGLITYNQDENNLFTSKSEIYQNSLTDYNAYNNNHNVSSYADYNYEKLYRQKVYDFLTDGNVKLFRGPAEGNYLVKLTDVSLTPNQQLGRMVWSFSATATEITNYSIDNMNKYDVLNFQPYINSVAETSIQDSLNRNEMSV